MQTIKFKYMSKERNEWVREVLSNTYERITKFLQLNREDLLKYACEYNIDKIGMEHFNHKVVETIIRSDFVVFIDRDGKTLVIKNRKGETGIVTPF